MLVSLMLANTIRHFIDSLFANIGDSHLSISTLGLSRKENDQIGEHY